MRHLRHSAIATIVVLLAALAPLGSAAQGSRAMPQQVVPTGGVQLDLVPWRAQVYVDGYYAGLVEHFKGYYQHLSLPAGSHVIDIFAQGYEPLEFEVNVTPGRTITYHGNLNRASGY